MEKKVIGIDVGGTNLRGALVGADGKIAKRMKIASGADLGIETVIKNLVSLIGGISEGEEEKVGCATIETSPAGEYRYFNPTTGLPASLEAAPTTSKDLSYFLAGNVAIDASGKVTVTAKVGGTIVGTVDIFVQPDSICISNIYTDTPTNPTPGDCTR
jgi:hypothetical protein